MNNISLRRHALLEIIKIGLGTANSSFDFACLNEDDWNAIMKQSIMQSVGLLCFDAIKAYKELIPEKIYNSWFIYSAKMLAKNFNIQKTQDWLVDMLESNNVSYVILKGASSAVFYPDSEKRSYGDIDFIVSENDLVKTEKLLLNNGCTHDTKCHDNHIVFYKDNNILELHFCVAGIPKGKSGLILTDYLRNITNPCLIESANSHHFHRPANEYHGVVLLLHTLHHIISSGVGLRQICDWACFVSKTHTEPFWTDNLLPLFKKAGLLKFSFVMSNLAVKYLGISRPIWLEDIPEDTTQMLLNEIFKTGSFGRNDRNIAGTNIMISKNSEKNTMLKKIRAMIDNLNTTNHRVYPILNKSPWLYPLVMFWRVVRFLGLSLVGKRQSLIIASKFADERSQLLQKFDLYITDKEN